jgi:hypothetical protein
MSTITCYIINREESTEIPAEVFEAHLKAAKIQGRFIEEHPPLVLLTTEGLAFAALYEINGKVQVEMFRYVGSGIPTDHPVFTWLSDEHVLVDFAEVRDAVQLMLPVVDKVLLSSMFSNLDPGGSRVLN